jgi:DNA repair protein RecO
VWDWSETSQTVSLFSREHGLLRCVAKGAKRDHSAFSGGLEVFTIGEMVASIKTGGQLSILASWDLGEIFPAVRQSLSSFNAAFTLLDLTLHAVTDHDPHPPVFDGLLAAARALGERRQDRATLLWFLWLLLSDTGHRPELQLDTVHGGELADATSYAFSPRAGGLTRDDPTSDGSVWRVRAETVELLRTLAAKEGEGPLVMIEAAPAAIHRATRLLAMYYREVFGVEPAQVARLLKEAD